MTLQAATWFCVAVVLVVPWLPWLYAELMDYDLSNWPKTTPKHSRILLVGSSAIGVIAQLLTVTSLFAYQRPRQRFTWRFLLASKPEGKAYLYFFIIIQFLVAFYALVILYISDHFEDVVLASSVTLVFTWSIAVSASLTHGVGGPWLNEGYSAFQPGRGGYKFILLQFMGWGSLSLALVVGLARVLCSWGDCNHRIHPVVKFLAQNILPSGASWLGVLGLFSQIVLTASLLVFEEDELERAHRFWRKRRETEQSAWLSCATGLPPEMKRRVFDYI